MPDCLAADEGTAVVGKQPVLGDHRAAGQGNAEPDQADRLFRRAAARAATPVTASVSPAREWASAPSAISSAVSRDTAPCAWSVAAETPSISILASLE
ncbi:hypothetical protein AJ88_03320 [Mesorhizobium amorphae CCBAU 01583]|nr:hypothetical protein AJ88_03320 [Mesorhizobium amorphae CCBAU 01583]